MKILLKETIDTLGIIGSECDVAPGYARNYLFPQGKAIEATPQNKKMMTQTKAKFDLQIAKEKKLAEEMAEKVKGIVINIKRKVHDETKLYGSIKTNDIKVALDEQEISIERRSILLAEPIKELGEYKVPVRLYKGVKPEITVQVELETES